MVNDPVYVPTFSSPEDKILLKFDSALREKGKSAKSTANKIFFMLLFNLFKD